MRQMQRVALCWAAAMVMAVPAFAHFKVARTEPANDAVLTAPPAKVAIWFSEKPEAKTASIKVEGPGGAVQTGKLVIGDDKSMSVTLPKTLAAGKYTWTWEGAGDDGHVLNGTVSFTINATAAAAMPVAIRFAAVVGDKPFRCVDSYEGIGTTKSSVKVTDFRLFASNVRLVTRDGAEVPVRLVNDGLWQTGDVALLDFEDATGTCVNGTPEMRSVVEGEAPAGDYTGVRFALGLPFDVNHRDVTLQPSPLNLSRMFWSWNAGYKFMRIDLKSTGQPKGWMVHLGSTGCQPGGSPTTVPVECKNSNAPDIDLPMVPGRDVIQLDLKALLAESNVDVNQDDTPVGCMSGSTDDDCVGLFKQLGLAFRAAPAGPQHAFSARTPTATVAEQKR